MDKKNSVRKWRADNNLEHVHRDFHDRIFADDSILDNVHLRLLHPSFHQQGQYQQQN